ncbi:hypothetical protein KHV-MN_00037 [Cyprinid herpesvirus 3]|uniref:Uncharacterized protein n=2 Tax=Cyprinid herpesvirus 3 TaxID=180230 RepID=A4FTD6_CYHV3|nr:hypothetical protein KHV-MN_00037 [Cyprinid herpesvirus 3]BAF48841.1 hypothetical protein [Cyprinid herpesvirus 3]
MYRQEQEQQYQYRRRPGVPHQQQMFPPGSVVVVLGGAGFIGRRVVEHVLNCGHMTVVCVDPAKEKVLFGQDVRLRRLKFGYTRRNKASDRWSLNELFVAMDALYQRVYVVNAVSYHPLKLGRPSKEAMDDWGEFTEAVVEELTALKNLQCAVMLSGVGCSPNLLNVRAKLESTWLKAGAVGRPAVVLRTPYVYGPHCPLLNAFCFQPSGLCPGPLHFAEVPMRMVYIDNVCSAVNDALVNATSLEWVAEVFAVWDSTPTMTFTDLAHEVCVLVNKRRRKSTPAACFWPMETMFGDMLCEQRLRWLSWAPRPVEASRRSSPEYKTKLYPGWKAPHSWASAVEIMGIMNDNAKIFFDMSFSNILNQMQPKARHYDDEPDSEDEECEVPLASRLLTHV